MYTQAGDHTSQGYKHESLLLTLTSMGVRSQSPQDTQRMTANSQIPIFFVLFLIYAAHVVIITHSRISFFVTATFVLVIGQPSIRAASSSPEGFAG